MKTLVVAIVILSTNTVDPSMLGPSQGVVWVCEEF